MVDAVVNHADVAKIVEAERLVVLALPVTARLTIDAPFADRLVVDAFRMLAFCAVNCVAVVVASVVVPMMFADPVTVAPSAERLVVDALTMYALVVVLFDVDALVKKALVVDERAKAASVVVLLVMITSVSDDDAAVKLVIEALTVLSCDTYSVVEVATVSVVVPVNVLSPANVWVVVDTSPRAVAEAFGMLKVWVPVFELILKSVPD